MSTVPPNCDTDSSEPVRYPTNHVVGVLDTPEQVAALLPDLEANGFVDSEIRVYCGRDRADALDASTGRRGLAHIAMRFAELIGVENVEMKQKERYETALRDGKYLLLVAAPTEVQKDLASAMLIKHKAHTVSFHGRFTIETLVPPKR